MLLRLRSQRSFGGFFEDTVTGPDGGYDATSITVAVASLGAVLNAGFAGLSEVAAMEHPGAASAHTKPVPPMISLAELRKFPDGSLARELLSMWVDNGFDPEVLDRQAIGLENLSPALGYLNTRILQMHDVWHLMAGYQTTSLHEMAISAFQLAQFGHNYSAMFLTTVCTMSHLRQPQGFGLLLQNLSEAWHHGIQCPPFMAVDWGRSGAKTSRVCVVSMASSLLPAVLHRICWNNWRRRINDASPNCLSRNYPWQERQERQ